ncbi:hypothetical protein PANO111632_05030 [Paracoccus nototheniae]|uniref:Uncharacterized protein n=1 Tax=Paracoccus nototheniae TaxID=2489002 RepID=A0ABW4DX71_9RHOB|nr:hypothetical protein [Paracoccus nototheniae]
MTRKIYDVRIYAAVASGFDIIVRVRGGIMKEGSYPTIEAALKAAHSIEGKRPGQPVYVYGRTFPDLMAEAVAPALMALGKGGEE